jgi:hypothetical protein
LNTQAPSNNRKIFTPAKTVPQWFVRLSPKRKHRSTNERTIAMTLQRRWLKSIIAASAAPAPAMPWTRGQRRKPKSLAGLVQKPAIAAR